MNERFDTVVVGAGLAGLSVAARLQQQGRRVLVLDGAQAPGGRGVSPRVGDVPHNLGPHALYLGGAAERLFKQLEVPLNGFVPDPADGQLVLEGRLQPMPSTVWGLLTSRWLTWRDRLQLAGLMRNLSGVAGSEDADGSLALFLDRRAPSPRLRALLEMLVRLTSYTQAPEALPAALALRQLDFAAGPRSRGVRYLDGGWQSLVDALASRVEVRLGHAVRRATPDSVTLQGGQTLSASSVVLAVPLPQLAALVEDETLQRRADSARAVRAATLDLVLTALPVPKRRLALSLDAPLYFSVHSRPEAGRVHLHVAEYRALGASSTEGVRERLEAFLDLVQPGWRGAVEAARFLPSLSVMQDVAHADTVTLAGGLHHVGDGLCPGFLLEGLLAQVERVVAALAPESGKLRA